jgi:4-alpha-glucanotransferase
MGLAWSSMAALSMAPLQDLLNLGKEARMNVPGRPEGNWRWRCTEDMLSDSAFEQLRDLTKNSNRSGTIASPHKEKMLEAVSKAEKELFVAADGLDDCWVKKTSNDPITDVSVLLAGH